MISIRPGSRIEYVVELLRRQHPAVSETLQVNPTDDAVTYLNAYLRWVSDSIWQLRDVLTNKSIEELLLTRRYWLLHSLVGQVVAPLKNTVTLEIEERSRLFTEVINDLQRQSDQFEDRPLYLLDTNVYLHSVHEPFSEPFLASLPSEQYVAVIIPTVVIEELDRLKSSSKKDVQTRARTTLRFLEHQNWIDQLTRLRVPTSSPEIGERQVLLFLDLDSLDHVRVSSNDSEILNRASAYAVANPGRLTFITRDTAMLFRARQFNIPARKPSDGDPP